MIYLLDTNIFLRYFDAKSKKITEDCETLFSAIKENKIEGTTTNLSLSEVYWTLKTFYNVPKEKRIRFLNSVINLGNIKTIDGYVFPHALVIHKNTKSKFIDCMIASIPKVQSKEWVVVSYDKDFDKLDVIRKEPGQIKI